MWLEVRSMNRRLRLELDDAPGYRMLLVPVGTTDVQVLALAADAWEPPVVELLRAKLAEEEAAT